MARYAPVCSPDLLMAILHGVPNGVRLVGGYHLFLVHEVLQQSELYKQLTDEVRHIWKEETFIILDNGVVELGTPAKLRDIAEAFSLLKPSCVVLPDVLGDYRRTVQETQTFLRMWLELEAYKPDLFGNCRFMAVPQGSNFIEIQKCVFDLMDCWPSSMTSSLQYFGIPRLWVQTFGTRMCATKLGADLKNPIFHLLGMSDNYLDDIACAHLPGVMGIDSANPIVNGLQGKITADGHSPRPPKYFDIRMPNPQVITNLTSMRSFIDGNI